jgi:hypothetical protein
LALVSLLDNSANFGNTNFNSGLFSVFHMKFCDWSTGIRFTENDGFRIDPKN